MNNSGNFIFSFEMYLYTRKNNKYNNCIFKYQSIMPFILSVIISRNTSLKLNPALMMSYIKNIMYETKYGNNNLTIFFPLKFF